MLAVIMSSTVSSPGCGFGFWISGFLDLIILRVNFALQFDSLFFSLQRIHWIDTGSAVT